MGKAHSHAWRNLGAFHPALSPVRQQVLVGRDPAAVKEAAARYGWAETATDWRDVVTRPEVDLVDVCTPGQTHAEIAIAALEAGKHVLVEKPLANSVAEGELMVRAAEAAAARGVRAMVPPMPWCSSPWCRYRIARPTRRRGWRRRPAARRSPLQNLPGSYQFDGRLGSRRPIRRNVMATSWAQ